MITRDNYEIYFTDYLDGNLSASDLQEMKNFLIINSDLQELLEDMDQIRLSPPNLCFKDKTSLKKENFHECPDYYAIAIAENALTEKDKKQIHQKETDSEFQKLTAIYQKLKLKPDLQMRFRHKELLYRRNKKTIVFLSLSASAALLLLILTIALQFFRTEQPSIPFILPEDMQISDIAPIPIPVLKKDNAPQISKQAIKVIIKQFAKNIENQYTGRLTVAKVISQEQISLVNSKEYREKNVEIIKISSHSPSEITLNKNAEIWKPSGSNLQSKNLITEVISAGKNIAEIIRSK